MMRVRALLVRKIDSVNIGPGTSLTEFVQSVEDACHVISSQSEIIPSQARLRDAYQTVRSVGPILVQVFGALAKAEVIEGAFETGEQARFGDASMSGSMLQVKLSLVPR
jgi:hypothetical protein